MATIPNYTNRSFLSATIHNIWQSLLLNYHSLATAPLFPMQTVNEAYSEDNDGTVVTIWSGYLYYTGDTDTFRYSYYHIADGGNEEANTQILVNGSVVHSHQASTATDPTYDQAGTVDISGLGLSTGTVYPVILRSWMSGTGGSVNLTVDVSWLGLYNNISYTSQPTYANGTTVTAANLAANYNGITECDEAAGMPRTPGNYELSGELANNGAEEIVWRGFFYHVNNTLRYRLYAGADSAAVTVRIYIDGTDVTSGGLYLPSTGTTQESTISISGLGLSRGTRYEMYVTMSRSGTSSETHIFCDVWQLSFESTNSLTAPNIWSAGDADVSAANLNWISTAINTVHPAAASPTAPLYYEQPAVMTTGSNKYYVRHNARYLHYLPDGTGTSELFYGSGFGESVILSGTATLQSYDLSQISELVYGQYYYVDDVDYAQEADNG